MDNSNITIEEYIRLEEEKARRHGKVYNWETAKYGKIWYDEDVHDLRSVETEFPAIVFNDELSSEKALSCEPTISSLTNNEIDFRISFDESDDEDYTIKMDDPNITMDEYIMLEEEKAHRRAIVFNDTLTSEAALSCEPTVSSLNDNQIDFRILFDESDDEDCTTFSKDFENEIPAIVYNDALTSKSDSLTEPILNPQHIDEFNLKDETSLSECDEEEQNILYFNDLFPFNTGTYQQGGTTSAGEAVSVWQEVSRSVWVYILKFKHEAFGKFKEWKQLVENQTRRTVKKLRTDNGLEFCNREFEQLCIESGITRHMTVAGTPQ
ncbi:putative reverse transcriptase domain-containing protein [Tanacetum coccineum]